jgi:hypothetical protein
LPWPTARSPSTIPSASIIPRPAGNAHTGWLDRVTLRHLATHTAGFEKPGGYTSLVFEPGTKWLYSDGGPNWLAECVTLAYRRDADELLRERVFAPIGIGASDLAWRKNAYRPERIEGLMRREFGSGVSANVDAMARIGYLYLRRGEWNGRRLLPEKFIDAARRPAEGVPGLPVVDAKEHGKASNHYGLLWWNNADGTLSRVPRDAYWSWGLYDSLIVVIPSLDIVVARAGRSWKRDDGGDHYDVLDPFLEPIAAAAGGANADAGKTDDLLETEAGAQRAASRPLNQGDKPAAPPYPASPVIAGIEWAPAESIIRRARGSDNWPMTWGDDDRLYTAYGDGVGFEGKPTAKLSMGLAVISGSPGEAGGFVGENLPSPTAEARGDGAKGRKASGMLMVDGTLFMWVRNAANSQLGASADRGRSWQWADWRFTASFGCPTFLNFGRNYAGARDEYVYIYSHDSDSAYEPADRMVMARVPKGRLAERGAYQFFAGMDGSNRPRWSADIADRAAVFTNPGRCYRSSVGFNAPLQRYLWVQIIPGGDTRFEGGFGIYDAPEPWGPWTTAFHAPRWDVGPGESAVIPTKWIGGDGSGLHLVFSGDDHFSVRQGTIRRR